MIIDSHAHLVPPDLIEEIKDVSSNFPSIEIISSNKSISFLLKINQPDQLVISYLMFKKE